MLAAVKCAGSKRSAVRVFGPRISGSNATTIGVNRTQLRPTAMAVSQSVAPAPSAEIMMTCDGPAQTSTVDAMTQPRLKP